MRLFMPSKKKRVAKKPGKTVKVKRDNKDSTQRRHQPRSTAPFGRPAK